MSELSFGEWLKRQRGALGLTQKQLANQIGCSEITLRKLEAEERRPSEQIVERFVLIFNIPKNEQKDFLRFARGNWESMPSTVEEIYPWKKDDKSTPSNLPAPINSFIGRQKELAEIGSYLQRDDIRLVTLIGPPGIGKTRLSLEISRTSFVNFPDGVFFVALAPLDNPQLISSTILQALDYVESKELSPLKQLLNGIGSKRILLVLDNCEHLIEDVAPLASQILSACSRLKIITTSRESLRIPGEWLYSIPTLDVPKNVDIAQAEKFPALMLFAERARAVRAGFALNADNIQVVTAICAQLDGLPLAIELIASRIRLMSAKALLENLNASFILSADGMRAVAARQKTLNNAISWTYNQLAQDEKNLFESVSVFSGGFTLQTAEGIFANTFKEKSIRDLITSLLDKSMLQRNVDENDEVRLSMLVTIQQFALEQLRKSGQEVQARDAHLEYYLKLSEWENLEIRGPSQVESARRIQREHGNLRAALEWSISTQKTESALRLLAALGWHWELQAHYREYLNWLEHIRALPDVREYPLPYANALSHIGRYLWTQDTFEEARKFLLEVEELASQLGREGEICLAVTLNWLGLLATFQDEDYEKARSLFTNGLTLYQQNDNDWGAALSTFHLGILEEKFGHTEEALSLLETGFAMFQKLGDLFFTARASIFLGYLHLNQNDFDKALHYFSEHLRIDTELQFWDGIAEGWRDHGILFQKKGEIQQAEEYFERGRAICREHGLIKKVP